MDTAQVTTLAATMFGIVTVLVAIFALMWQMNSQNSRLEAKIDTEVGRLEAKVDRRSAQAKIGQRTQRRDTGDEREGIELGTGAGPSERRQQCLGLPDA